LRLLLPPVHPAGLWVWQLLVRPAAAAQLLLLLLVACLASPLPVLLQL
jgi:hypothetical protein